MVNIEFKCSYCNKIDVMPKKQFDTRHNHFCSRQCFNDWNKENHVEVNCLNCGKLFLKMGKDFKRRKYHLCSRQCFDVWMKTPIAMSVIKRRTKERIAVKCEQCSKEILRLQSTLSKKKHFFCSKKCNGKWTIEHKDNFKQKWVIQRQRKANIKCVCCGKITTKSLSQLKDGSRQFCSRKCFI